MVLQLKLLVSILSTSVVAVLMLHAGLACMKETALACMILFQAAGIFPRAEGSSSGSQHNDNGGGSSEAPLMETIASSW